MTMSEQLSQPLTQRVSKRVSQSVFDGSRLRVVLLLDLYDGAQEQFMEAYEHLRNGVASVPGHISDQLCQSIENPSQWLISSEWESAPPFLAWVNSEEHVQMVRPLHSCVKDTRSMRFHVLRETTGVSASESATRRLQASPRIGDGVTRHALTFTVKPGSEQAVARLLADYSSPQPQVDETTRLCRTSLFMSGNRVVRAIEVRGDLLAALRHVARQPEARAVEEAINPYLEQARDLNDPESARLFFTRAALPAVHAVTIGGSLPENARRQALYYPARPGCGLRLAELLARQAEEAADDERSPVYSSTIFLRDDIVVRLIDVRGDLDEDDPVLSPVLKDPRETAELMSLLDSDAIAAGGRPPRGGDSAQGLTSTRMELITDRRSPCA
ncbi:SchA/CurD-like domain-containing protein [Streptomyces phyllanthi]|uniref:TcmI family type II polyketide cyclase n=1 Tax=Streptomyces phyllanthi TaxID=1803180 RepID=A0A5N8VWI6_9ACTN|nr:SchA/CurD-like domain-containing protein [Streptomyces phyllanthi]MPY39620.1 TcmI family type II polyketide cyclase [Streptomyces phyllanthi]